MTILYTIIPVFSIAEKQIKKFLKKMKKKLDK